MAGNYELGSLIWRVKGDTRDFDKKLKSSDTQTKKFGGTLSKGAKSLLKWGAAAGAAALSIGKIISTVKESVKLYGDQITAEQTLKSAIEQTGESADDLLPKYKDLASEIQNVTTEGDESTLALMQQATALGINSENMEEATKGAIGLSKSLGIGTQQAIRGVANAFEGNFTTLQRYIPALRTTEDESEKLAIVQKAMADGFEVAKAEADSGYGALIQYDNAVGDLKEQLGETVVEGVEPLVGSLTNLVTKWTENIARTKRFEEALKNLRSGGEVIDDMGLDQIAVSIEAAKEEMRGLGDFQIKRFQELEKIIAELEKERERKEKLVETERQRQKILDKYGDKSQEYYDFLETQQALELEAAKKLEEIRENSLSAKEKELENIQEQINYWAEYRGEVEGAEEIFKQLAIERNELRKELREENEEQELTSTAIITQAQRDALNQRIFERRSWELEKDSLRAEEERKEKAQLERRKQQFASVAESYVTNFTSAFSEVGAALYNQEDAWAAVGRAALGTVAEIVRALGKQLAAQAAALYVAAWLGDLSKIPGAIAATAASAAAFTAAGVIEASAQDFETGGFVQPRPGTPSTGDNVPARLNPREVVLTESDAAELLGAIRGGKMGGVTVNQYNTLNTDSEKNMERAARQLYPYMSREGSRRG